MHFIIQNIEKTALLSKHINLLTAEMELETADQKMQDFEMQVNLAERKQQKPFSEKAVKRDFEMIIISDEKKMKKKKNKKLLKSYLSTAITATSFRNIYHKLIIALKKFSDI
ncbi:uncharacterized protein BDCG_08322 [Blastomyces dermatitidis ER-3]|uniref:Uncharacterized protein n=1 Tax=Ajellomyces dermatitidis (strain ER-3 / ATCC MYA-2586) TaxID=559297 RepID=A0ABP2EPU7_AJEDR|nr:uncharacterized protein BDCG_08322 [Blastomyces dermatitidis ER-3]EEQ85053.2 hypothetical protein BDCG_08322 [Blastomyces dermatitidis ER-3]